MLPNKKSAVGAALGCLLGLACTDPDAPAAESGSTSDTESTSGTESTSDSDSDTSESTSGTESTSDSDTDTSDTDTDTSDTGAPLCGNGTLDPREACDDANDVEGDGCNNDCRESGQLLWLDLKDLAPHEGWSAVEADADGQVWVAGFEESLAAARHYAPDHSVSWSWASEDFIGEIGELERVGERLVAAGRLTAPGVPSQWVVRAYDPSTGALEWSWGYEPVPDGSLEGGLTQFDGKILVNGSHWDSESPAYAPVRALDGQGAPLWAGPQAVSVDTTMDVAVGPGGALYTLSWADWIPMVRRHDPATGAILASFETTIDHFAFDVGPAGEFVLVGGSSWSDALQIEARDPNGALAWTADSPGQPPLTGVAHDVRFDPSGDFFVTGQLELGPGMGSTVFVSRFALDGEELWRWTSPTDGVPAPLGVGLDLALGPDSTLYVATTIGADGSTDGALLQLTR